MRPLCLIVAMLAALMGGCSGLVRGFIDTQPRVTLDQNSLADPSAVVGGTPVAYVPGGTIDPSLAQDPDLARWAPIIVQGFQPENSSTRYERTDDAIGSPRLSADATAVSIDTTRPAVYARVEHASVAGSSLKQLVYAFWYPRRPLGSVETGSVDGGILRVTLDDAGSPAVFEYSQPCGCFHGVFVSQATNDAATREFGAPAPRRLYAVEPPLSGHDDWVVRSLVKINDGERIAMYLSAGRHFCQAIASRPDDELVRSGRRYEMTAYDVLQRVPCGDSTASMFNSDGLVIGAERRAEQMVMGDLNHAGWPRHLDTMLIHWDAERWTDPSLLSTKLRLPAVTSDRHAAVTGASGTTPMTDAPVPAAAGRRLMLFTNAHCSGCQLTKNSIQESPRLQRAIRSWSYKVVDTASPEGAQLAAENRVTLVPVLVGFDGERELFREEDIDTADKIAAILSAHR